MGQEARDYISDLERLGDLKAKGVINDEEFASEKRRLSELHRPTGLAEQTAPNNDTATTTNSRSWACTLGHLLLLTPITLFNVAVILMNVTDGNYLPAILFAPFTYSMLPLRHRPGLSTLPSKLLFTRLVFFFVAVVGVMVAGGNRITAQIDSAKREEAAKKFSLQQEFEAKRSTLIPSLRTLLDQGEFQKVIDQGTIYAIFDAELSGLVSNATSELSKQRLEDFRIETRKKITTLYQEARYEDALAAADAYRKETGVGANFDDAEIAKQVELVKDKFLEKQISTLKAKVKSIDPSDLDAVHATYRDLAAMAPTDKAYASKVAELEKQIEARNERAAEKLREEELRRNAVLEVLSFRCSEEYGYSTVEGEVRNLTSEKLENVTAVGEFRTAGGDLVTTASAIIEYNPLMPGQRSPFKAMTTHNPLSVKCGVEFKYLLGGTIPSVRAEAKSKKRK